jgi:tRNA threonylcarbamoyladenosine biosynthesis protein TsaE
VRDPHPPLTAFRVHSAGEEATLALGEAWGRAAADGSLWLLSGELGAGKTTLVRGVARGLGVASGVRSPSFALHLTYPGRLVLHHLDLYRVTDPRDLDELGLEDLLGREGLVVVEWGERLGDLAPPDSVRIRILDDGPDARRLEVTGPRDRLAPLAAAAGVKLETVR